MSRVITADAGGALTEAVAEAAVALREGGLVAFPTETFYGLGADALNEAAVARLFAVKGRPETKPVLVLVDSVAMAAGLVTEIPDGARRLMELHWPGPLTLVLRAAAHVPGALGGGTGTLGLRIPGHPLARALVRAAGKPITAPSANPSGEAPPTTAALVERHFGSRLALIVDGGPTAGGPASTVADCTVWPPRVLRQGPVAL
jgi:L-threonylcarbamoyladenylate synthase